MQQVEQASNVIKSTRTINQEKLNKRSLLLVSFYSPQMVATVNTTKLTIENDLTKKKKKKKRKELECGPMPNVMVALPNIGGALCSTPQSLVDAHY